MKKRTVLQSTAFRIFLYLLFVMGVWAGSFGMISVTWIWANGGYFQDGYTEYQKNGLEIQLYECELMSHPFEFQQEYPDNKAVFRELQYISERYNVAYVVENDKGSVLFDNTDEETKNSPYWYHTSYFRPDASGYNKENHVSIYVDTRFDRHDEIRMMYFYSRRIFSYRYALLWVCAAATAVMLLALTGILKCAGHKKGQETIAPGIFRKFYPELLGMLWLAGFYALMLVWRGWICDTLSMLVLGAAEATAQAVWLLVFLYETAIRLKLGNLWSGSLAARFCTGLGRGLRQIATACGQGLRKLPAIRKVVVVWFLILAVEALVLLEWRLWDALIIWGIEKIIITPIILYCELAFHKLLKGSEELADGHFSEKVDASLLIMDFRKHGENLNRIGDGISRAVEERLKSERMKTELITNVSHDLKTPLTSVINYADILGTVAERDEQVKEYAEVLKRQANRLKRLLDDLVEASKATTGNLEVVPVPCELGVLLTQAAGEYEEKFAQKHLQLRIAEPGEEVRIMADSRHLWRIFDNLLNNIWKYAQEDSRVYLNMTVEEKNVTLVFRNISKYELNVSAAGLEERFVRGDASRHMEGSGLGLSIAKSLAELQGGTLGIVIDGDLFKVILTFPISFSPNM